MIVVARESRGWTQRQLAKAARVVPSTMSRAESGVLRLSADHLAAICLALNYDTGFLAQNVPIYSLGNSLIFHRQRARISMRDQKRVQAEINVRLMQIRRLLENADVLAEHRFPSITPDEFNGNAERVAREVKRLWSVPDGPIPDLTQIVENAGGIVAHMDFHTVLIDGAHLWVPGLPPIFFMNSKVSGERYRYSLAHELGHAIMHHASGIGEVEQEANRFAAEFLMPRREIRSDLRNLTIDRAARIKPVWKVSIQALIRRAKDLRIITESKYRSLCTTISARGNRVEEPWPLPVEEPVVVEKLLKYHVSKLQYADDDVRTLMFTDRLGPIDPTPPQLRLAGEESLFRHKEAE